MNSTLSANAKKSKEYIYFIRIGKPENRLFKIGTTNNIDRRMKEHKRYYKEEIFILGVIPVTSKYTTLRVEENTKNIWKKKEGWKYLRNDRFIIPRDTKTVDIKVRKTYTFKAE